MSKIIKLNYNNLLFNLFPNSYVYFMGLHEDLLSHYPSLNVQNKLKWPNILQCTVLVGPRGKCPIELNH